MPIVAVELACRSHGAEQCQFVMGHINNITNLVKQFLPPNTKPEIKEMIMANIPTHMGSRQFVQKSLDMRNQKPAENVQQGKRPLLQGNKKEEFFLFVCPLLISYYPLYISSIPSSASNKFSKFMKKVSKTLTFRNLTSSPNTSTIMHSLESYYEKEREQGVAPQSSLIHQLSKCFLYSIHPIIHVS